MIAVDDDGGVGVGVELDSMRPHEIDWRVAIVLCRFQTMHIMYISA